DAFRKQYEALKPADKFPNDWSYEAYMGALMYAKAITAAKSTHPAPVAPARAKIAVPGPLGAVRFNPATHESTTPTLVFQTAGDAGSPMKLKILKYDLVSPTNQIIN